MHTRMNTADLIWWAAIIGIQACLAVSNRHSLVALRAFLAVQAIMGCVLLAIARIAGPWTYFYSWITGTVIHHSLCAFLMWSLFMVVRSRGLPTRQNRWPIVLMGVVSLAWGLYFAIDSNAIINNPWFRRVIPLDHALSFSIGCMLAGLPFYATYISAVIPRHIGMVLIGFGLYEFAYSGILGITISAHPRILKHAVDFVYLVSLFLWSKSLPSKSPLEAAESTSLLTL